MAPRLTHEDDAGTTTYLRPGAIPLVVAAICVPIVIAMFAGVIAVSGSALGLAAGAIAVASLLVLAARTRPGGKFEVAGRRDAGRRVLVVAIEEVSADAAQRVAVRAGDAVDVRLVVPLPSRAIDRWTSAEDEARVKAGSRLAASAGALVAAGLPVSGSLGDADPQQSLEDALREFPADEVILLAPEGGEDPLPGAASRLGMPLTRLPA